MALATGAAVKADEVDAAEVSIDDATVVATVGGTAITAGAVRREMLRSGGHDPHRFDELEEKRAALEAVVRVEVLARAAIEAGYDKDPAILEEFKRLLGQRFWADQQREREIPSHASEEEIQSYYEAHRSEFEQPVQVRGSLVLLRGRADATDEDRRALQQKAEAFVQEVHDGRASFAEIARQHSDDRFTRERGGDIGWVTPGNRSYRWEKAVLSVLSTIEMPGSRPRIVSTDRGVYLVYLTGRRGGDVRPLGSVRSQIKNAILAEKQRAHFEADYMAVQSRFPVQVDEDRLRAVNPGPAATVTNGPPAFPIGKRTTVTRSGNPNDPAETQR